MIRVAAQRYRPDRGRARLHAPACRPALVPAARNHHRTGTPAGSRRISCACTVPPWCGATGLRVSSTTAPGAWEAQLARWAMAARRAHLSCQRPRDAGFKLDLPPPYSGAQKENGREGDTPSRPWEKQGDTLSAPRHPGYHSGQRLYFDGLFRRFIPLTYSTGRLTGAAATFRSACAFATTMSYWLLAVISAESLQAV